LPDGRVLFVGGFKTGLGGGTLRSAEIYNPATQTFAATGSMITPYGRFGHDAILLPGTSKVLIVGGKERRSSRDWRSLRSAEIYDAATGKFTTVGDMRYRRDRPTVAWVDTVKKVLVAGGKTEAAALGEATGDVLPSEWFDPATKMFSVGPSLAQGRMAHTLTTLPGGGFLVAGGFSVALNRTTETAERFDPPTGKFVSAGKMRDHRHDHGAAAFTVTLPDGIKSTRVLIMGGKKVDQNPGGTTEYPPRADVYTP